MKRLTFIALFLTTLILPAVSGHGGVVRAGTPAPVRAAITTDAYVTPALTPWQRHLAHLAHLEHLAKLRKTGAVTTAPVAGTGAAIAAYARTFAGPPHYYAYGGEGPLGFDCSGLAQVVYAHFGRHIPRIANDQAHFLHPASNPQPGDLVFYWSGGYAYHTAIYLGAGTVVSALDSAEGIRVTPVSWPGRNYSFGTLR